MRFVDYFGNLVGAATATDAQVLILQDEIVKKLPAEILTGTQLVGYSSVDYGNLLTAITAIGSEEAVLFVYTEDWIAGGDVTVPITLTLIFEGESSLLTSSGDLVTINGSFTAPRRQVFSGGGEITFGGLACFEIYPEWWGAVADDSTDCYSALTAALEAANGLIPIQLSGGTYRCSDGLAIENDFVVMRGLSNCYSNSAATPLTTIKFTGGTTGIDAGYGVSSSDDIYSFTLQDLYINGNDVLTTGIKINTYAKILNCQVKNCTGTGIQVIGPHCLIHRTASNSNGVGLELVSADSIEIRDSQFSSNDTYGLEITGAGYLVQLEHTSFEQNQSEGLYISGTFINLLVDNCNFETSTYAPSYFIYSLNPGLQSTEDGIVLRNCYFASAGATQTKIGNFASGKFKFENCSYYCTPSSTAEAITADSDAEVILEESFTNFDMPKNVRVIKADIPEIDRRNALYITEEALSFSDSPLTVLEPGTADFTFNIILEPLYYVEEERSILFSSTIGGFGMNISVGASGHVDITEFGESTVMTVSCRVALYEPIMLTYVRSSGVGYLYRNGRLINSAADTTDYNQPSDRLGMSDYDDCYCNFHALSMWNNDLTADYVYDLFRNKGIPESAQLTTNLIFNLRFDKHPTGYIYESISAGWVDFTTEATWLYSDTPEYSS